MSLQTRTAPESSTPSLARAAGLSIPEFDVGTAVRNNQLVGASNHFAEGTAAWFWTRVEGGQRGDRIHHVWLRQGEEAARVSLRVGGSRWRTHSSKILRPGSAGDWAVEARDNAGRLLARREFVVIP